MVFKVGDRVSNLRGFAEDQKLYGIVERVALRCLVRWDHDNVRDIPKIQQRLTWEEELDLILESRGEETHMRTFTQEEQDYILKTLADPTNDTYIAGGVVKNAQELATRTKREANLKKAAELVVNALIPRIGLDELAPFQSLPISASGEEKHISVRTTYGIYRITISEDA